MTAVESLGSFVRDMDMVDESSHTDTWSEPTTEALSLCEDGAPAEALLIVRSTSVCWSLDRTDYFVF